MYQYLIVINAIFDDFADAQWSKQSPRSQLDRIPGNVSLASSLLSTEFYDASLPPMTRRRNQKAGRKGSPTSTTDRKQTTKKHRRSDNGHSPEPIARSEVVLPLDAGTYVNVQRKDGAWMEARVIERKKMVADDGSDSWEYYMHYR